MLDVRWSWSHSCIPTVLDSPAVMYIVNRRPEDLVQRQFAAPAPNRLWLADHLPGDLVVAASTSRSVMDMYSAASSAGAPSTSLATDLAADALEQGLWQR